MTIEIGRQNVRSVLVGALVATFVFAFVNPAASQVRRDLIRRSSRPIPGRYLVLTRSGDAQTMRELAAAVRGRGRVRHVYGRAIRGFALEASEAVARALALDPAVASVEEDGLVAAAGWQSLGVDDNWGLDRIDQRHSFVNNTPAYDGFYRYAAEGAGVHVYVVDTGIRTTHVEFGGRAVAAFDVIGDGNGDRDCHGHGTHVAGIVGGARFGVAKRASLYSVRALGCDGYGTLSGLALAIDWVVDHHLRPAVISMSIGASVQSDAVNAAIQAAITAGITFVGAAGNDADDSCSHLVGGVPDALVVGASGYSDAREPYSNYGRCVDVFAPGGSITSAYAGNDTDSTTMSGTSMATPHVAGAAALYLERNASATPAQVAAAILTGATVNVINDPGPDTPNRLLFTAYLGDVTPPRVSFNGLHDGAVIKGHQALTVSAIDDVELKNVVFSVGDRRLGTDSRAPYSVDWDTTPFPDGTYAVSARAVDLAGNSASATISVVVRNTTDQTPPQLTLEMQPAALWPPTGTLVPVHFTGSASDDASPILFVSFNVEDEYGRIRPSGTVGVSDGRFSFTVYLEASRRGQDRDGRHYRVTVTAHDVTGNQASATAEAVVPHDRRSAR